MKQFFKITSFRILIVIGATAAVFGFLFLPSVLDRFSPARRLTIIAWPRVLDASFIHEFEKEYNIPVSITFFENYEELFLKLKSGQGRGYDLLVTTDYIAEQLIQENLLKPIDKSRIHFWDKINERFLGHYYDPENKYTIPFSWDIWGIGVNKSLMPNYEESWDIIFKKSKAPDLVGMLDDPREIMLITGLYLFGQVRPYTQNEMKQISSLLRTQKEWVGIYSDLRTDFLLASGTIGATMAMRSDLVDLKDERDDIEFVIPREGSFQSIDSLAISKASTNLDRVYAFLNYLYQPEIYSKYMNKLNFLPILKEIPLPSSFSEDELERLKKLHFMRNVLNISTLISLWIKLKS